MLERDVGDAHHFAALRVDDLLVEQVAHQAQHVLVGVVGREHLVAQVDAVERDGADLIVADGQPGPAAADQEAVDADGVDQRDERGVFDHAEPAALQVIDLEAHSSVRNRMFSIGGFRAHRWLAYIFTMKHWFWSAQEQGWYFSRKVLSTMVLLESRCRRQVGPVVRVARAVAVARTTWSQIRL